MEFPSINRREKNYEYAFIVILLIYLFFNNFFARKSLFAGGGASDPLFMTKYVHFGYGLLLLVTIMVIIKFVRINAGGKFIPTWVDVIGFDPEESIFRNKKYFSRIVSNPILQFTAFLVISIFIVVILSAAQQSSLPESVKQWIPSTKAILTQQTVDPAAGTYIYVEPAASDETLDIVVLISIFIILAKLLYKSMVEKGHIGSAKITYKFLLYLVIPVLGGLSHYVDHFFRYGAQDTSLTAVFMFGLITAYLIVLFFSIIPAIVYHQVNNLIGGLYIYFASSNVSTWITVGWLVLVVVTAWLWISSKDVIYTEKYPSTL